MITKISILGSTGSIGTQTLDVVSKFPDQLSISALSAGENIELLKKLHPILVWIKFLRLMIGQENLQTG